MSQTRSTTFKVVVETMLLTEGESSWVDTNHDGRSGKYQSNTGNAIQGFRKRQSVISQAERGECLNARADSSSWGMGYSMSMVTNGPKLVPCCVLSSISKGYLISKSLKSISLQ